MTQGYFGGWSESSFLGKSNFGAQSNPKAEIDDVKIFNKSLSKLEIIDALNSYY